MSAISVELRISLVTGFVVTVLYLTIAQNGVPGSSSLTGHGLGIIGFLLMLGAEFLYSDMENQPSPLRAVGYRRVSSKEQTDGHSLDAQEVHIRNYAQSQNWNVIHFYCDAGISAKKDSRRPALEQLMADAEVGKFDVVIVDKVDRFYRHLGGLLKALDELNSHGVAICFSTGAFGLHQSLGQAYAHGAWYARGNLYR